MPSPGFHDLVTVVNEVATNSTSYLYSNAIPIGGANNKVCFFADVNLGAGLTSVEFKFQQGQANITDASNWFTMPIDNVATLATSADTPPEYYIVPKAWTQSVTATDRLGPFPITVGMPFVRVAYKVTGAGTGTFTFRMSRILL